MTKNKTKNFAFSILHKVSCKSCFLLELSYFKVTLLLSKCCSTHLCFKMCKCEVFAYRLSTNVTLMFICVYSYGSGTRTST